MQGLTATDFYIQSSNAAPATLTLSWPDFVPDNEGVMVLGTRTRIVPAIRTGETSRVYAHNNGTAMGVLVRSSDGLETPLGFTGAFAHFWFGITAGNLTMFGSQTPPAGGVTPAANADAAGSSPTPILGASPYAVMLILRKTV